MVAKDAEEIYSCYPDLIIEQSKVYADLAEAFNEKNKLMSRSSLFESSQFKIK